MKTLEIVAGGFKVFNDGIEIINQPFDPRTGSSFESEEAIKEYAAEFLVEHPVPDNIQE